VLAAAPLFTALALLCFATFAPLAPASAGVDDPSEGSSGEEPGRSPSTEGPTAPDSLRGFDLSAYAGQVVVLDFWASWCAPCKHSFPWLQEMHERYAAKGLAIVAVDLDKNPKAASSFLKEMRPSFRILEDPKGDLAELYGLEAMPTSFVYDRGGELRDTHLGFKPGDREKLEAKIRSLLDEPPPAPANH
jgi:thiol-disulfide isomerase/thioredoxin